MTINEKVRKRRLELGMSQEKLAKLSGLSRRAIVSIDAGTARPHIANVDKLAIALDVPFEYLYEDSIESLAELNIEGMITI